MLVLNISTIQFTRLNNMRVKFLFLVVLWSSYHTFNLGLHFTVPTAFISRKAQSVQFAGRCNGNKRLQLSKDHTKGHENAHWVEFRLPRSFLSVSVLEAEDMEVRALQSLQNTIDKPLGIFDWVSFAFVLTFRLPYRLLLFLFAI